MADVAMAEARFIDSGGREWLVQLPGSVLREGSVHYDEKTHKGHLRCVLCDARVNYDPGSRTIAGGLKGPSPHFQRNTGQQHNEECLIPLYINEGRAAREYDKSLGYKIHLNTRDYSELFNNAAYPYDRGDDKKIVYKTKEQEAQYKDMQPLGVKTIADLVKLMKRGDYERLQKAVVIQKGADPVSWPEFFVRYARSGQPEKRFSRLVDNLDVGRRIPVLMEVFNEKAVMADLFTRVNYAESRSVRGRDGLMILPRIWLDNRDDMRVRDAFALAGRYLVLGYPRLRTKGGIHYVNISVTDCRQVELADVDDIAHVARKNHEKRSAGTAAPSAGK